jgi:hypothetical protein
MSWSHVENRVGSGMASVNTEVAIFRKGLPENVTCEQSPEKGKKKNPNQTTCIFWRRKNSKC